MGGHRNLQPGFTLIEVLLAITILLVGTLVLVPLLVYARDMVEINNRKTVAVSLANTELERIRAMEFKDIGVEKGNPSGILKEEEQFQIDGVTYTVKRRVSWIAQAADCTSESEKPLWDYKLVEVEVSADAPRRPAGIVEKMETQIARSSFQEPSPGAGLRVCAFRGWRPDTPVGGVKVTITGPGSSKTQQWTSTTSQGAALFFLTIDKTSDYAVYIDAPRGMMVHPDKGSFNVSVPSNGWVREKVYVEYPCYITVTLKDAVTGNIVNKPGNLVLRSDTLEMVQSGSFSSVPIAENVLGSIWPLGGDSDPCRGQYTRLVVTEVEGYHDTDWNYQIPEHSDGSPWDGTFPEPGTRLPLTIHLVPIPPTPPDEQLVQAGDLGWLGNDGRLVGNTTGEARSQDGEFWLPVKFSENSPANTVRFSSGTSSFSASAMYFEGNLVIGPGATLILAAELFKFANTVALNSAGGDSLILTIPEGMGIDGGSLAGGMDGVTYGEVHFVQGLYRGEAGQKENLLGKGAFYFPSGVKLPQEVDRLIPKQK